MNQELEIDIQERYKIAIEARNFHYDNFNKWLTYFYVAIAALFAGYCSLNGEEKTFILILGYVVSIFWYLSCKGYYYWNIHWICLIQYYEKQMLGLNTPNAVYSIFWNKRKNNNYLSPISGANISTSKIAILFCFIIAFSWGMLLSQEGIKHFVVIESKFWQVAIDIIISGIATIAISFVGGRYLNSDIKDMDDLSLYLKNNTSSK